MARESSRWSAKKEVAETRLCRNWGTNASSDVLSWVRDDLLQELNRTDKQQAATSSRGPLALNLTSAARISPAHPTV
jgi:hypothetical protein